MRRWSALAIVGVFALAGCSNTESMPTDATPSQSAEPSPSATPDTELEAFTAALAGGSPLDPDALVAAIEAAGFPRSSIERTNEVDSLGEPVTYLEVAVRVADGCLIGQVGEEEPLAQRAGVLGGERCLIGDVIALD